MALRKKTIKKKELEPIFKTEKPAEEKLITQILDKVSETVVEKQKVKLKFEQPGTNNQKREVIG